MKEFAWVVFNADGEAIAIDHECQSTAWANALAVVFGSVHELQVVGFRCLRVRLVEVGP